MNHEPITMKKYILKPGKHQFAPGSPPVHSNDNLTDEEAEWYLRHYPHIAALFPPLSPEGKAAAVSEENTKVTKRKIKRVDASTPPSGGKVSG